MIIWLIIFFFWFSFGTKSTNSRVQLQFLKPWLMYCTCRFPLTIFLWLVLNDLSVNYALDLPASRHKLLSPARCVATWGLVVAFRIGQEYSINLLATSMRHLYRNMLKINIGRNSCPAIHVSWRIRHSFCNIVEFGLSLDRPPQFWRQW